MPREPDSITLSLDDLRCQYQHKLSHGIRPN